MRENKYCFDKGAFPFHLYSSPLPLKPGDWTGSYTFSQRTTSNIVAGKTQLHYFFPPSDSNVLKHFTFFQVKSEHHHLELQEAPWLYLKARSAGEGSGIYLLVLIFSDHRIFLLRRCYVFAPVRKP